MRFYFEKFFFVQASILVLLMIMYLGRAIFIPFSFALLGSFILFPVARWIELKGMSRLLASLLTLTLAILLLSGAVYLFSKQLVSVAQDFGEFTDRLEEMINKILDKINSRFQIPIENTRDVKKELNKQMSDSGYSLVSGTIIGTSKMLAWLGITIVSTFLLLFYRTRFVNSVTMFVEMDKQAEFKRMLMEIRSVGQNYLIGMILLILIMGLIYSTGLLIVGLDYPFFFGYISATLAVIPYVGTAAGGIIPLTYALVQYESNWYPLGVIIVYVAGQTLEGNFLTPFIVGSNLHVNALAAIITLIIGGIIWGIPGMIIFLPLTAMVNVLCQYYENLKPLGEMISDTDERNRNENYLLSLIKKVFSRKKKKKFPPPQS